MKEGQMQRYRHRFWSCMTKVLWWRGHMSSQTSNLKAIIPSPARSHLLVTWKPIVSTRDITFKNMSWCLIHPNHQPQCPRGIEHFIYIVGKERLLYPVYEGGEADVKQLNKETTVATIPLYRCSLCRRTLIRSVTSEEKATMDISCTYQQHLFSKVLQFPKGRGHWVPCHGRVTWVTQSLKSFTCTQNFTFPVQIFTETQACNAFEKQQLLYILLLYTWFLHLFVYGERWTPFFSHFFLINRC